MRIVFFCWQLSHLEPTLPVIQKLIDAGHELICVVHDSTKIRFEGMKCRIFIYDDQPLSRFFPSGTPFIMPLMAIKACEEYIPKLLLILRQPENFPDLIIFETAPIWGYCISKILNVPHIQLTTVNTIQLDKILLNKILSSPLLIDSFKRIKDEFQVDLRIEHSWVNYSGLNLFTSTPLFIPLPLDLPKANNVVYIGPQILPRPKDVDPLLIEQLRIESSKRIIVYVGFGSVLKIDLDFGRFLVDEFSTHPELFFLISNVSDEVSSNLPTFENVVVRKWVPQLEVLKYVNIMVNHGGFNTIHEAFYINAVPMIAAPIFGDAPANAKALEASGSGLQISKDDLTKSGVLWAAIQKILDNYSVYKQTAEKIQASMKAIDPNIVLHEVKNFAKEKGILKDN